MTGLSLESVMRRFQDVHSLSQEAIETISLWVMHYKDKRSIDIIVEAWLESFKIAKKDEQRIALFYIMNDVVQRAKNKHMDVLIPAFQPAVLSAVSMGKSSPSVKHVMTRCVDIFGDRQVFTEASVNVMKNMLQSEENGEGDDSFVELDSEEVYRKIELFERGRLIVTRGMEVIRNGDFDCRALMKERMRDRTVAAQLVMETQQVLSQISSFRHSMEEQKRKMLQLIETLELVKRNFSHQLKDVTVVEDAYQKYFQGIREVHADLLEMEKTGVYPAATPPRDAPSPTANDDIYATGVENALQSFRVPGTRDNLESTDMELDDDSVPIDVGGTSPLSGHLPPPPAPPAVLESRPAPCLAAANPQTTGMPTAQLSSNGAAVPQLVNNNNPMPAFHAQSHAPYGAAQPQFTQQTSTAQPQFPQQPSTAQPQFTQQPSTAQPQFTQQPSTAQPQFTQQPSTAAALPSVSQPPPAFLMGQPPNMSMPPPMASHPSANIQALLKSIPSLQTLQQASAAAAAAAAANAQNPPQMNFPPPTAPPLAPPPASSTVPLRFGDVDERVPPTVPQSVPQQAFPIPTRYNVHPPPRPQQPMYAEEGPSHVEYQSSGAAVDHENRNGDGNLYGQNYPSQSQRFHNAGNFPPHGRGRPRGEGFYGRGGRGGGDQWRKSGDFRGGRGFGGGRGNRGRGGFHSGGFQGGGYQRGRGRGSWSRDEY